MENISRLECFKTIAYVIELNVIRTIESNSKLESGKNKYYQQKLIKKKCTSFEKYKK